MPLSPDVDRAEAHHHVTAGHRAAEAHHWAEARKEQNLIQLVAQLRRIGTGQNAIRAHTAFRVDGDIDEEIDLENYIGVLLFRIRASRPTGIIRKRDQFRWPPETYGLIVRICLDGNARQNHMQYKDENNDRPEQPSVAGTVRNDMYSRREPRRDPSDAANGCASPASIVLAQRLP